MDHHRALRLSWLITIVTAMALAVGIYMAGAWNDAPGAAPQDSGQLQTATVSTSADHEDEVAGDSHPAGRTTVEQETTHHDDDSHEPEETDHDD